MKTVAVCLEHRFFLYEDKLYTKLSFPYDYWKDYLMYFTRIIIIARVKKVTEFMPDMVRVDGPGIDFETLPYYVGPRQFFITLPILMVVLLKVSLKYDYFLLRSGNSSSLLWVFLMVFRKSYLREYPGNVKEGIIGFAGSSVIIKLLARFLDAFARLQGKYSRANSFVSHYCRDLYASTKPSFVFSSFRASEIKSRKILYKINFEVINIVSLGRLENEKGHKVLLEALAELNNILKIRLHLIGDGSKKLELEEFAKEQKLNILFYGAITDREILFSIMENADLFIIPSLTEGMPRALLEAMAIGLPCVGTSVGGIPEVLPADCMCAPNDHLAMSSLIKTFATSADVRESAGQRNIDLISLKFNNEDLYKNKIAFWSMLYG